MIVLAFMVSNPWTVGVIISFFLFLIYLCIHRSNIKFIGVVEIIVGVEGLVAVFLLCRELLLGLTCYAEDLEKTFLLIGAIASIWLAIKCFKDVFSTSKPH